MVLFGSFWFCGLMLYDVSVGGIGCGVGDVWMKYVLCVWLCGWMKLFLFGVVWCLWCL